MKNICVLIPAYNEEKNISKVLTIKDIVKDIVVIDDGSTDNTIVEAEKHGSIILRNKLNQGKGAALRKGFGYALEKDYQWIMTLDADGQHLKEDAVKVLEACNRADIIIGARNFYDYNMPFLMRVTNKVLSFMISVAAGAKIHDTQSGLRLIKRDIFEKIFLQAKGYEIESELLIKAVKAGFTVYEVPIKTVYFKKTLRKTIMMDILMFTSFFLKSLLPVKRSVK